VEEDNVEQSEEEGGRHSRRDGEKGMHSLLISPKEKGLSDHNRGKRKKSPRSRGSREEEREAQQKHGCGGA